MIKETGNEQYDARAREDCPLPAWNERSASDSLITTQLARYKKSSAAWAKKGVRAGTTTVRTRKPLKLEKKDETPKRRSVLPGD